MTGVGIIFSGSAALAMTLHLALDGYGPACNVTGDGTIAIVTQKLFGKKNN